MLTRLKVSGFKNLVDVDVQFGPFTCIAGPNGVGKSNLFDAIRFLSVLADLSLLEAAMSVRDEVSHSTDVRSIFHRVGEKPDETMSFEAEMIIPLTGVDDLGQPVRASITFVRYCLDLAYRESRESEGPGRLEILREELTHISKGDAFENLRFPHNASKWRMSAVTGRHFAPHFISTEQRGGSRTIKLHQDSRGGPAFPRAAASLPRTVLSGVNTKESPTVLLTRREMQSWRILQLEPTCLRRPDLFNDPQRLGSDGSHLASTLFRLARRGNGDTKSEAHQAAVYSHIGNNLARLIGDVREVSVDSDVKRELRTIQVTGVDGTCLPARALSDGTLRFLALSVLEQDPDEGGLICLEEPENGIHPARIPAMVELLEDIATDTEERVGPDNPLRQVIVNTHSPLVVAEVAEDSLLFAEPCETVKEGHRFRRVCFACLDNTWRSKPKDVRIIPKGDMLKFLAPVLPLQRRLANARSTKASARGRRVIDRDLNPTLFEAK